MLASSTLFAWAHLPKIARAEGRDPRFLTIILRGALVGLATVAPVGDPDWLALRGDNALTPDGKVSPPLKVERLAGSGVKSDALVARSAAKSGTEVAKPQNNRS